MTYTEGITYTLEDIDQVVSQLFDPTGPKIPAPLGPKTNLPIFRYSWSDLWGDVSSFFGRSGHHGPSQGSINQSLADVVTKLAWGIRNTDIQAYVNFLTLDRMIGQAATFALTLSQQAVQGSLAAAEGYARGLFGQAESDIRGAINYAAQVADGAYNRARADLAYATNVLEKHISNVYWQGRADLANAVGAVNQEIAQAERLAASEADGAYRQAHSEVNAVQQWAASSIAQATNTLAHQITNGVNAAEAFASGVAASAGASAFARAVAQLQPQVDALKTETDTCLQPLCDTVTPNSKQLGNLGKLLKAAEDVGLLAALMALVAEALADPEAAATQVVDLTGWIATAGTDLVDAVSR